MRMEKLADKCTNNTDSQYYDKVTGKHLKMTDLQELRFDDVPQKFNKTFDESINDRDEKAFTNMYIRN